MARLCSRREYGRSSIHLGSCLNTRVRRFTVLPSTRWKVTSATSSDNFSTRKSTGLRFFFFSSRRRHTIFDCDWSSDVCSSDLLLAKLAAHITVTRGAGNLDAEVEFGLGQRVTVRHLVADLPLDPALIPG